MDMTLPKLAQTLFKLYIPKYRGRVIAGSLLALLFAALSLSSPLFTRIFLDDIILSRRVELLPAMLIVMLGVIILGAILNFSYNYVLVKAGQRINLDIKFGFFNHLIALPLSFFRGRKSGEINFRLFTDTDIIQKGLLDALVNIFINISLALAVSGLLLYMNWRLALLVLSAFLIQIVVTWKFHEPIRRYAVRARKKGEEAQAFALERIDGIELIRAYSSERQESRRFHQHLHRMVKALIQSFMTIKGAGIVVQTVNGAWAFIVLWYGTHQVLQGHLTIGSLMAFIMLSQMLYGPIATITNTLLGFQEVNASISRFSEIYFLPKVKEHEDAKSISRFPGEVIFDKVSFGYTPPIMIINEVSFHVNPGEVIAVVGKSGVGKSTLLSLIPRLYDPTQGRVLIDNMNVRELRLRDLRQNIGIVLQGTFTFSGTVRENLTYGLNTVEDETITAVLKTAGVYDFITSLPEGFDTKIGERGVLVSKGEAQLIAIARLLLQDPSIVILDEPTSFLDLESEFFVSRALEKLMSQRTIFIIAHRLSTISNASRIFLLEKGKLNEFNNADDLILSNPQLFRRPQGVMQVSG